MVKWEMKKFEPNQLVQIRVHKSGKMSMRINGTEILKWNANIPVDLPLRPYVEIPGAAPRDPTKPKKSSKRAPEPKRQGGAAFAFFVAVHSRGEEGRGGGRE